MDVKQALVAYIATQSGITSLIGSSPVRLYPMQLPPETTLPAATYQTIGTVPESTHNDGSVFLRTRLQITVYGVSANSINPVANAFDTALDGYRGLWGTLQIQHCLIADRRDDDNPESQLQRVELDYFVLHEKEG